MSRALAPPPLCLLLLLLLAAARSADILAVFPHTGKSHFDVFQPLVLALAARGHRVTVISFYPQQTPVTNYTDVSLVGLVPLRLNQVKFELVENPLSDWISMSEMGLEMCDKVLNFPAVKGLLQSQAHFDLLIVEIFNTDCFLSLAHRYGAPYVGITSANGSPEMDGRVGTPAHPAYVAHPDLPYTGDMTLPQRVVNIAQSLTGLLIRAYYRRQEQTLVARLVGPTVPSMDRLAHGLSAMLVNTHHSMTMARPLTPGYVEIGGIHIYPPRPLDKELEQYMNESDRGIVIFSMGSVLQSSSFPEEKRQAIMEAFAELPVRVLMKWEEDSLPGRPDNVRLSKWLPQRDLLAHPKVVLLMGHGGYLSTSEAVYCGVPMVLTPMFGDQPNNVAHLEALGAAIKLDFTLINKQNVLHALRAVLYDSSYRRNVRILSERFKDRPMSPLDTAVYWTEYVLRHRGAPHLRSPAVDMPWYQLWLLDVIGTVVAALILLLLIVFWLAKRITLLISRAICSDKSTKKTD